MGAGEWASWVLVVMAIAGAGWKIAKEMGRVLENQRNMQYTQRRLDIETASNRLRQHLTQNILTESYLLGEAQKIKLIKEAGKINEDELEQKKELVKEFEKKGNGK